CRRDINGVVADTEAADRAQPWQTLDQRRTATETCGSHHHLDALRMLGEQRFGIRLPERQHLVLGGQGSIEAFAEGAKLEDAHEGALVGVLVADECQLSPCAGVSLKSPGPD